MKRFQRDALLVLGVAAALLLMLAPSQALARKGPTNELHASAVHAGRAANEAKQSAWHLSEAAADTGRVASEGVGHRLKHLFSRVSCRRKEAAGSTQAGHPVL